MIQYLIRHLDLRSRHPMLKKLRSKKDARLYFKYIKNGGLKLTLSELKTLLIKKGYIEHVEGDRYLELKRLPGKDELK